MFHKNIHNRLYPIILIVTVAVLPAIVNAGALYRYRSFNGPKPTSVSSIAPGGNISHTALPAGDVLDVDRGAGFTSWTATDFDGATEYVGSTSSITTKVDSSAEDSFSLEAIFLIRSTGSQNKIVSNTENSKGFCLRLMNGRLSGLVRLKNGSTSVDLHALQPTSQPEVSLNMWHRGVFTVTRQSSQSRYLARLYLDGQLVAEAISSSLYNGIYQSPEPPMVAAEPTAGAGTLHFLDGLVHSAVVRKGTLSTEFLTLDGPRDGTANLGFPNYPESLFTTDENTDKMKDGVGRFPQWQNTVVGNLPVPLLNDNYIPQGCTSDRVDNFYISMYWKQGGQTGDYPSIIAQISFDGKLRRVIQLLTITGTINSSHVGGCAYYNNRIYVAYGGDILRYDLADLPKPGYIVDNDKMTNIRADQNALRADKKYNPDLGANSNNSYIEIAPGPGGAQYLWTGQWDTQSQRRLLGFSINANGDLAASPSYNFKLFRTGVQGATPYRVTQNEISFYASSNPGGDGTVFAADYPIQATAEAPLRPVRTVAKGPSGIEDLTVLNGNVWSVSESAAKPYQTPDFYPFIYGMKGETSGVKDFQRY